MVRMIRTALLFVTMMVLAMGTTMAYVPTVAVDENVPTKFEDAGCDDPACPVPQPHPPHSRGRAADKVGVPTKFDDAGCDDPACPVPQPHPPH